MKKHILVMICLSILTISFCKDAVQKSPDQKKESILTKEQKKNLQLVPFSFVDRELTDIIDFLATKKEVNVIPPQGVNAIKPDQKITFKPTNTELITLEEAWKLLNTFLELSGYALTVESDFYIISKNDEKLAREIFPIYVNIPPKDLPNTDQRIRYVYYFTNLKINDMATWESLKAIYEDMLSPNKLVIPDPKSNGVIITDKASNISSVMRIIGELDATGFKETVEVIQLFNTKAEDVKKIFDILRSAVSVDKSPFLRSDPKADLSTYFPSGTVIQVDNRTNSLIIMGRESAVLRIREFIMKEIDLGPESGESILHVYDLQYLNSQDFARVLQGIVTREGLAEQSRGGETGSGPERFFNGVIITAESLIQLEKAEPPLGIPVVDQAKGVSGSVYSGGNRLVIAARKDDWLRIKSLIEKLDKPRAQVIVEVFIVDLRTQDTNLIAGDIRNTLNCNIDTGIDFLASHISPTNSVIPQNSKTIAVDLLKIPGSPETPNALSPLFIDPGSLMISFNDPCSGITALLQLLKSRLHVKVVSRPHIVTLNNALATVQLQDIKRDRDQAFTSGGGVPTIPIADITATVQVQVIPRISSPDRLALEVGVDINEFETASVNQITRRVTTNVNMNSGQVLVLGGLTRLISAEVESQTPILARIPIFGWFFRKDSQSSNNTNLAVFIAPTIVQPKLRAGMNLYTEDKVIEGRNIITEEAIYNNYRDPVTRFFFDTDNKPDNLIKQYVSHSTNAPAIEERKTDRVRKPKKSEKSINIDINSSNSVNLENGLTNSISNSIKPTEIKPDEKIKALLAHEDNPILSIPQSKRKIVFNG